MDYTAIIVAAITALFGAGGGLTTIILLINQNKRERLKEQEEKKNNTMLELSALKKAICQIMYLNIKRDCEKWLKRGYIPPDVLKDLMDSHKIYHTYLAGNGYLDNQMEAIQKLPQRYA